MKNKIKILAVIIAVMTTLSACGGSTSTSSTASTATSTETSTTTSASEGSESAVATQTSADNRIVTIGEAITGETPVLITSAGQSADASMLDALMKKVGVEYTFDTTATEIGDAKTVIIAAGASSKGLGAAGISADDEKARVNAILEACKANGATVVMAHLGGASRRGTLSDEFSDTVLAATNYIILVEDGNEDGKFTTYAADNNIPITLVHAIADSIAPLQELLA